MVKNKKFRKMPKISLVKNLIFEGGHGCFGPKTLLHFGQISQGCFFIGRRIIVSCDLSWLRK